jgi:hypothetical protein
MQPLVLKDRLAKMEFAQNALLRAPRAKHAAKAERHAARFAAMTGAARIPIIAEKAAGAWNANVQFPERPAATASVATPERFAVALGTTRHVAPRINTVTGMDVARLAKLQCAIRNRNAVLEHALTIHAVTVRTHARKDRCVAKTNAPTSAQTPTVPIAATLAEKEQNAAVARA